MSLGLSPGFVSSLFFGCPCRTHDFGFHRCSIAWLRDPPPGSFVRWGERRTVSLRFHRGLSNNASLDVIAQLRLQNQELSDRLASQQSVNGSVMAQARHTPATFSDAPPSHPATDSTRETVKAQVRHTPATNSISSMVHPAAEASWKTKKTKFGLRETLLPKLLSRMDGLFLWFTHSRNSGWPTRVFVLPREARQKRRCASCAREVDLQVVAGSEEIEFEVKTSQGLSTMWKCDLVQLGDVPVTYKCSAPRGGALEADTFPFIDRFPTQGTAIPMRGRQPRSDRSQLPHIGSRNLVRSPWTSYHPDPEGPIVSNWRWPRVQKDNFEKVLRGSGEFGVFSRPFFVKGDARVCKDVPLPVELDLQAAMRKAKAVGPSIFGVVLR